MVDESARGRRPRDAARFEDFLASLLDSGDAGDTVNGGSTVPLDAERTQLIQAQTSELTAVSTPVSASTLQRIGAAASQLTPATGSGLARVTAGGGRPSESGRRQVPTGRSARAVTGPQPLEPAQAIGLPNDHGLTSAGLVCEALSSFGLALAVILLAITVTGFGSLTRLLPPVPDGMIMFALVLCVLRAIAHGMLGRVLTRRDRTRMFRYVKAYFGVALVQTVVLAIALGAGGIGALGAVTGIASLGAVVIVSIAWPAVLLGMVLRPSNRRAMAIEDAFEVRVLPNDRGVAGAGTIMLVGGVMAALGMGVELFAGEGTLRKSWVGAVVLLLLMARSCVHAYAGFIGLRRPSAASFAEGVTVYRVVAYVSGGAFALIVLLSTLAIEPLSILVMLGFVYLYFLVWPRRLTRFTHQVAAEVRSDDIAKRLPQAPDGGLSALGYVLLWVGCYLLATFGGLVFSAFAGGASVVGLLLFGLVPCALAFWAGLELACMTRRWRLAASVYGGVTALLNLLVPPLLGAPIGAMQLLSAALALLTLVLVLRPLRLGAMPGDMVRAYEG